MLSVAVGALLAATSSVDCNAPGYSCPENKKRAVVTGAGGFIGGHLVKRLQAEGYWVRGVDIKRHEYFETDPGDEFLIADMRDQTATMIAIDDSIDEVYNLAADMGGAGYINSGLHDADVVHNSAMINLNVAEACKVRNVSMVFFSSSACVYPEHNQLDARNPNTDEETAYPAHPDSEYGWEKLFAERIFQTYARNYGILAKIARFHNIFGPFGTWDGGKEKAPAALMRKVAMASAEDEIEIWGDGKQTRSFMLVHECIDFIMRLVRHPTFHGPINIGSDEMVEINELAEKIIQTSGKQIKLKHIDGPLGVRGRSSNNTRIEVVLGARPSRPLQAGIDVTYEWILQQVEAHKTSAATAKDEL